MRASPGTSAARHRPPAAVLVVSKGVRRGLILMVRAYQLGLGWLLGGQCRFYPTCSHYAIDALRTKPVWKALLLIAWRIARCQPLCRGGFDEVKPEPADEWFSI